MFCPRPAPLNPGEALECLTLPHSKRHSAQRFVLRPVSRIPGTVVLALGMAGVGWIVLKNSALQWC